MRSNHLGPGFWCLLLILLAISFVVTFEWGGRTHIYVQGEIAEQDIMADRSFNFRDTEATRLRREAVQSAQPAICTLNLGPAENMLAQIKDWFIEANRTDGDPEASAKLHASVSEELGEEITIRQFGLLADPEFQGIMNNDMIPWIEERLRNGIIDDIRKLGSYTGGVIIRNLETGTETVVADVRNIADIKDLQLELDSRVRGLNSNMTTKKFIVTLLGNMAMSTLTINEEATRQNAVDVAKAVQQVVQYVAEGEVIVRQGEKISAEQLVKLNALSRRNANRFRVGPFLGLTGFGLFMCAGLFFSPGARKRNAVRQKDMLFIGVMLFFTVLLAKVFGVVGLLFSASSIHFGAGASAFAVPVGGVAGLLALTLSSRHQYVISLFMAGVCAVVGNGGIGLCFYYFMGSMLCIWLLVESQSRKEVAWAIIPLTIGLLAIWAPSTLLQGGLPGRFLGEAAAVTLGSLLSIVVIFAVSPLVEIIFGFTTRFSLMELMNQEHKLLRQLMFEAPGTYHHSIIVANMAELAAKAIGAQSLLCKVGGIYHDIGKIGKAEYFIENQFKNNNPHDRLTPTMSALVLLSHVKRGVEQAQKHRLGPEITGIIGQHHGTSLIRYFYRKAHDLDPKVRESDFRYSGPKPQSREAALIMLADVVEASSRTLADPTPSRIRTHVESIVRSVLTEGQLETTELTFKDLDKVTESFVVILTGIFHKRIEYPDKVPARPDFGDDDLADAQDDLTPLLPKGEGPVRIAGDYGAAKWLVSEDDQHKSRRAARKIAPVVHRDQAVRKVVRQKTHGRDAAAPDKAENVAEARAELVSGFRASKSRVSAVKARKKVVDRRQKSLRGTGTDDA